MKQVINADPHGRVTLQGYDPVAFHAIGAAMRGNPAILLEYGGYKYLFSSEENKELFEKAPEKYLPAYGGYCAFGASLGVLFPVEIDTWEIIDGRLVLQFSQ
ncbi:MAG: YHS domain-containing (seleno)protein, partial [Geobacteraceae bacterium]|nr:YHS domain-containing (seleno)protein [Geobacteraceae bacterium]